MRNALSSGVARALALTALGLLTAGPLGLVGGEPEALAKDHGHGARKGRFENGCRVQSPQRFLERRSYHAKGVVDPAKHGRALRWLVERYGNADDDATTHINPQSAHAQATSVHFMGMPISVHAKIAPALACVEKRIAKTCTAGTSRYTARAIGGFRSSNTYRGGEVSNHLLGIAVDIDPDRNPCCGCVDPWPNNPLCKKPGGPYQRASLPACWVKAFDRYGFDWLGLDEMQDTMHFEFLADPDRITK